MRKHLYISLLAMLLFAGARAQDKKYVYKDSSLDENIDADTTETKVVDDVVAPDTYSRKIDTTLYQNDNFFPGDSIIAWRDQRAFLYTRYLDSLLKAKKNDNSKPVKLINIDRQNIKSKEEPQSSSSSSDNDYSRSGSASLGISSGLQIFLWVIAGCFVLFILYKLFLTKGAFKRESKKGDNVTEPTVEEEIITPESDFDRMIRLAFEGGNYRLAVRYQYLKSLNSLAVRQHISLAADKTNYQYVQEIANTVLKNEFSSLTLNYEYIWYGEFVIDGSKYQRLAASFSDFNKKI